MKLLRSLGAEVLAACFIIDLPDLGGAQRLAELEVPVRTLVLSRALYGAQHYVVVILKPQALVPVIIALGRFRRAS